MAMWKTSIALLAVLAASGAAHAGIVFMSCSGTANSITLRQFGAESNPIAIAVDLDKGTVSVAGHEPWPIVNNGRENTISFVGSFVDGTRLGSQSYMDGTIDRVTGVTMVRMNVGSPVGPQDGLWQLMCKPVQPLF
jgi:hypothetical protein